LARSLDYLSSEEYPRIPSPWQSRLSGSDRY